MTNRSWPRRAQLATFGAVSDETARAAEIFHRATAAAADLAAARVRIVGHEQRPAREGPTGSDEGTSGGSGSPASRSRTHRKSPLRPCRNPGISSELRKSSSRPWRDRSGNRGGHSHEPGQDGHSLRGGSGVRRERLLPALEALAPVLGSIAGFVEDNVNWLLPLVGAIGGVVVAVKAWGLTTEVWQGIQRTSQRAYRSVIDLVMGANPVLPRGPRGSLRSSRSLSSRIRRSIGSVRSWTRPGS